MDIHGRTPHLSAPALHGEPSLLLLVLYLGVSTGTLGLHILKCCSFNSQDTFCGTKFLLIIQVAFKEEFHLLWCQAQVYDPLKDVPARNQSDSDCCVGDSTQYKPCNLPLNKEQKVEGDIQPAAKCQYLKKEIPVYWPKPQSRSLPFACRTLRLLVNLS